jgi:hypothetical protein
MELCLNVGAPAHDVARASPPQPRRTQLASARGGAEKPSGPRPALMTLCTRGCDACVEA